MKKFTASAALLLCAVILLCMFTACNNQTTPADNAEQNIDNVQKPANSDENTAEPLDLSGIDLSKVNYYVPAEQQTGYIDNNGEMLVPEYVLKINGIPVTIEEYRYPYLNIKASFDGGDDTLWTEEAPEESRLTQEDIDTLKDEALNYFKQTTAYQLMAVKYDLPLTEDEKAEIDSSVQQTIDSMNAEGSTYTYEQALNDSYFTDGLYRYTMSLYTIANKIFNYLYFNEGAPLAYTPDEMVKALADAGYIRTQQLLIKFPDAPTEGTDEEKAAAVEQGKADAKAKAEEVLAKIKNGEDFMEMVKEYNDDPGMDVYGEDGYYFTAGTMVKEYEDASFALEEGAVSDIVETSYGYHIIKRMPLEADYIAENAQTYMGEVYSSDFTDRLEATFDIMNVEYAPEYDLVSPLTVK